MVMLAADIAFVIGVDTHKDTHSAAVLDRTGSVVWRGRDATTPAGLRRLVDTAHDHALGQRLWAIEQTGSYGSGLVMLLEALGEVAVEIDRPSRPARRNGAKNDDLDAVRAAREALSREHLAAPRSRGRREAIRALLTARRGAIHARTAAICQLKALVVIAAPGRY
jgi:hypothetical protein